MEPSTCLLGSCLMETLVNCSMAAVMGEPTNVTAYHESLSQTMSSGNASDCIPAGEMHRQTAVGELYVQILFGFAYCAIWFAGATSNIVTLIVAFSIITGRGTAASLLGGSWTESGPKPNINLAGHRRRTTSTVGKPSFSVRTIFVFSLACSDLLTSMTSLPVTAVNLFTDEWPFPAFVCPGVGFLQAFSIFQSSFTFTAIAVDRFLLILFSNRPWPFTYKTARVVVIGTAMLAFALAFPMFAFVAVVPLPPMCGQFCVELWPEWASVIINQRTYGLFVLTLQFGLPTVVTGFCYFAISQHLRRCHKTSQGKAYNRSKCERRASDRRRRANAMMISMICCFVILWSPFNALNILRDFGLFPYLFDWSMFGILYAVAHLIAMTSVVWNPFIYAWYNQSIREVVVAMFQLRFRSRRRPENDSVSGNHNKRRRSSLIALAPLNLEYRVDISIARQSMLDQ